MRTEHLDTLKKQVADIVLQQANHPLPKTASIQDRLIDAYHAKTIQALTVMLERDSAVEEWQQFLQAHWNDTRSTFFTYTALPQDSVTTICCTIAVQLSETKNGSALHLLMPGIETESYFPDTFSDLQANTLDDLLTLIRTHILSDDGKTLIPVFVLRDAHPSVGKTPAPENAYPAIAIDANNIVNPYTNFHPLSSSELTRLALFNDMTRLLFESWQQYRDIAHDEDTLLGQLNKLAAHLASNSAHGGRGTQKVAASGAFTAIVEFNLYYQQLSDEQKEALPEDITDVINTLLRLAETESRDFFFDEDGSDLPELLEPGTLYLRRKGCDLFCSLVDLDQKEVRDIKFSPLVTKPEILNELARPKDNELARRKYIAESKKFYIDRTGKMETCVGTQSENLRGLLKAHVELLSDVKVSGSVKTAHLALQKKRYLHAQRSFAFHPRKPLEPLDPLSCNGSDHYDIQLKALKLVHAEANYVVRSNADVADILLLEPTEIAEICVLPGITSQIVSVIGTLENLVIWIGENQLNKLSVLLPLIAKDLFAREILASYQNISELLIALTPEKISVVCEALRCLFIWTDYIDIQPPFRPSSRLSNANIDISANNHFFHIMEELDLDQSRALCSALPDMLEECMRLALHRRVPPSPDSLTPDQRTMVYRALENQWQLLINDEPKKFHELMRFIPPELDAEVCEKFNSQLHLFIRNCPEFEFIFSCINDDLHRASLFQTLLDGNHMVGWIESPYHLYCISQYVDDDQFEKIYQRVKQKLADSIRYPSHSCGLSFLTPDYRIDLLDSMGDRLESLIENATHFNVFFMDLDAEHFVFMCNRLKNHLCEKMKDANDFFSVVGFFSLEKFTLFCDILQDWFLTKLTTVSDCILLFNPLDDDHCEVMMKKFANRLRHSICSIDDFCEAMQFLPERKRVALFDVLKEQVCTFIHTPEDFRRVLALLDTQQIKALCVLLKEKLHFLILMRTHQDLHRSIGHLEIRDRIDALMFFLKAITDNPRISFDLGNKDVLTILQKTFLMACAMRTEVADALKGNDFGKMGRLSAKQGLFCANPFLQISGKAVPKNNACMSRAPRS